MFIQFHCKKIISILFFVIALMMSDAVYCATFNISAEYNPDNYDPLGGRFINKTPCDMGYTGLYYCDPKKPLESDTIIQFPINITRGISSNGIKTEYLSYYRISGPKKIVVKNDRDGSSYELKVVPTHIGMETANMELYKDSHSTPLSRIDGDCSFLTEKHWGTPPFSELLLHSINPGAQGRVAECYYDSRAAHNGSYDIRRVIYGFRLESPSPLKMSNGNYTGSVKLSVGRNQDIDFGDGIYYGMSAHEINFKLTVRHQLRVEFPKGEGEGRSKVTLLPPRGWNDWIYNGRGIPDMLQQELPFRLWSNSPFTVALRCQYISGTECALKNPKGHQATLNTYFIAGSNEEFKITTIPFTYIPPSGSPVITRKIKFRVAGDVVKEMVKYPGSTYKGDVTLIFDAAID